jgi:hypothetical protein
VRKILLLLAVGVFSVDLTCQAQSAILDLPRSSQHAVVTQRIGLTDLTINYHRPLVNGRTIWGNVVPYGEVWRTGANENTTIMFTDPVKIEGHALGQGTYGLHMIPEKDQWTVIFSKTNTAWGSFSYDPKEDALRVTVKPTAVDFHEALTYDFYEVKPDSTVVTLQWEKLAVPFKVSVNVNEVVEESLRKQLRGLAQYSWEGWNDAADYLVSHNYDLDEALRDIDKSLENEVRFENLMTKTSILEAMGRKDEAAKFRDQAIEKSNAQNLFGYGLQLQDEGKSEEAFAIYRAAAKRFPNDWMTHMGLARIYSAQGDFASALKEANAALSGASAGGKSYVQTQIKRLEAKQDINK